MGEVNRSDGSHPGTCLRVLKPSERAPGWASSDRLTPPLCLTRSAHDGGRGGGRPPKSRHCYGSFVPGLVSLAVEHTKIPHRFSRRASRADFVILLSYTPRISPALRAGISLEAPRKYKTTLFRLPLENQNTKKPQKEILEKSMFSAFGVAKSTTSEPIAFARARERTSHI